MGPPHHREKEGRGRLSVPSLTIARFLPSLLPWALPSFNLPFEGPSVRPSVLLAVLRSFPTCSTNQPVPPPLLLTTSLLRSPLSLSSESLSNKRQWKAEEGRKPDGTRGRTDGRSGIPLTDGREDGARERASEDEEAEGPTETRKKEADRDCGDPGEAAAVAAALRSVRDYNNTVQKVCARARTSLGLLNLALCWRCARLFPLKTHRGAVLSMLLLKCLSIGSRPNSHVVALLW